MEVSSGASVTVLLCQKLCDLGRYRQPFCRANALFLTFIAYAMYHLSRRPLAVAKNALNTNCSSLVPPNDLYINASNKDNWCNWVPFEKSTANQLLGYLDFTYVVAYAIFMFPSGFIAERVNLRYFLSLGMILCGVFTYFFGIAYYLNIHSYAYFIVITFFIGATESTGWPAVVACVGNWFGKNRRGLIFGTWNAHLFVGNILGAYVSGHFVAYNWGLCFIIPAAIIGAMGFVIFLLLVPHPSDVGCPAVVYNETVNSTESSTSQTSSEETSDTDKPSSSSISYNPDDNLFSMHNSNSPELPSGPPDPGPNNETPRSYQKPAAISFIEAFKIPGVAEFSLCLFFTKLVSYTFMFWLPRYLAQSTRKNAREAAYLSVAFDIGGIFGGIIAGAVADRTETRALTCIGFLAGSIPWLFLLSAFGADCVPVNVMLQLLCGTFVNGPYALITTVVSTELGTHSILRGNSIAIATVTAIIDGIGSLGAAVGPLLAGVVSDISWDYVFYAMILSSGLAIVSLLRIGGTELNRVYGVRYGWCSFMSLCGCCEFCSRFRQKRGYNVVE